MAGVSKTQHAQHKSNKSYFSHDIVFDGALLSTTRASLIIELLKYFLYERQQIPLPIDHLESLVDNDFDSAPMNFMKVEDNELVRRKFSSGTSKIHKVKNLLDDLRQLFDKLNQAFELCPEIEQVAVLFGGTVVSPKESYIIKFPPSCPDADSLPLNFCKRNLFQQVIGEDFLGSLSSNFAPTNMTVLISAPRSCSLQWFLPKQTLRSPKLGTIISFNFHCSYLVPVCHDLTMAEGEFELSGLELIDCSQCELDGAGPCQENLETVDRSIESHEDLAEAGTATGDDEATLQTYRCSEADAVSLNMIQEEGRFVHAASSSPPLPRFCKHQRLNYIYSGRKYIKTNGNNHTAQMTKNPKSLSFLPSETSDENFEHVSHSQKTKGLTLSPIASASCETDCIWYQSPVVIKGIKFGHDMFPGKS